MVVSHFIRAALLVTFHESKFTTWNNLFIFFQALFVFFNTIALMGLGVSMLHSLVRTSKFRKSRPSLKKYSVMTVPLTLVLIAVLVPLNLSQQYALPGVVISAWSVLVWLIYWKVCTSIQENANNLMTSSSTFLGFFRMSSFRMLFAILLFVVGTSLYVVMWYVGHSESNRFLLSEMSALSIVIQYIAVVAEVGVMTHTVTKLLLWRSRNLTDNVSNTAIALFGRPSVQHSQSQRQQHSQTDMNTLADYQSTPDLSITPQSSFKIPVPDKFERADTFDFTYAPHPTTDVFPRKQPTETAMNYMRRHSVECLVNDKARETNGVNPVI
eukprot:c11391_g1_i1.p1 GENE.c11391_g1_i1~~c11391_g1_i1.p1  ORF type:complete len:366 (-),score=44.56 c11391_g1_i1:134-1111(-)